MSETLKKKTVSALVWNGVDKIGVQVIQFSVGILTARILSPKDFGLIGALTIFIFLSNLLITSGFTSALIRKENVTNEQYSAVLYLNITVSIVLYIILYFLAPSIANFFEMPELTSLSRLIFISIIFNSLGVVQVAKLTKEFKFKALTAADLSSYILTGVVTIWLSVSGYAYWAIAWQQVLLVALSMTILWITHPIKLSLKPEFKVIKELFKFSSNLLFTGFVSLVATNIYNVIIGKVYKVNELGFYSQAKKYQQIANNTITLTLQGVAYPTFTSLNKEPERQLLYLRKMTRVAAFIILPITAIVLAMAEPLITIVLSSKWLPFADYLRILMIGGLTYSFHALFISMSMANGKMKQYLFLEIFRSTILLASVPFCLHSIYTLLVGSTIAYFVSYFFDLFIIQKQFGYKTIEHAKDIAPYIILSIAMYVIIKLESAFIPLGIYSKTTVLLLSSMGFYLLSLHLLKSQIFIDITTIIKQRKQKK
ncbi:MAG: lipopolysaccharide biosynthesis protein [Paludibacteraceae bacterium]|nr:lipopolysaccharide biosynthesis protein [Paludibacteraceae bacterium]